MSSPFEKIDFSDSIGQIHIGAFARLENIPRSNSARPNPYTPPTVRCEAAIQHSLCG
jgi:hypothetical protein